jgi:uncharacterized protein (DUF2252 family)
MAAKLSKAKRPKRRWIGFSFPPSVHSRSELESLFTQTFPENTHFRIYDAHFSGSDVVTQSRAFQSIEEDVGIGIVCVNLTDFEVFRDGFSQHAAESGLLSLSSSGKIRLIRQRLGLPKPRKK